MKKLSNNVREKVISSLFWKFAERIGAQGVNFIVSLVLARLLEPKDYGLIALITIFISISNVFVQSGFGTALIQKKGADETDFSSVFYFNILMSWILYFVMFIAAPYIADFYSEPELKLVIRVLSISLIIAGINSVQQAYVSKTMQFKRFFFSTLVGTLASAVVGIYLAYRGAGVWALVVQQLFNSTVDTLVIWFTVKWRPKLIFSFQRLKTLFSFGWKMLISSLLDTTYNELSSLIIGKKYSSEMLAYYNRGKHFPELIINNINGAIQSVLLPALAESQEQKQRVKEMVRRSIVTSSFIIFPMMVGLATTSEAVVTILLTEKWLVCVPFMQINCVIYALYPIHTANLQAINALGRSDIFLKLEIIKKVIGLIVLVIAVFCFKDVMAIAVGTCIIGVISSFVNAFPNKRLLNYSYIEQIKDIFPSVVLSAIMGVSVWLLKFLNFNIFVQFALQVVVGGTVYIVGAKVLKLECLTYLCNMLRSRTKNK